jgi:hypothetical protein
VAHLLIEDQERGAILQFFTRSGDAAAKERQNRFEHCLLPVMSIAHGLFVAAF